LSSQPFLPSSWRFACVLREIHESASFPPSVPNFVPFLSPAWGCLVFLSLQISMQTPARSSRFLSLFQHPPFPQLFACISRSIIFPSKRRFLSSLLVLFLQVFHPFLPRGEVPTIVLKVQPSLGRQLSTVTRVLTPHLAFFSCTPYVRILPLVRSFFVALREESWRVFFFPQVPSFWHRELNLFFLILLFLFIANPSPFPLYPSPVSPPKQKPPHPPDR